MYIIHAHIKVKPQYRNLFLEKVEALILNSQMEEGNMSYQLYESTAESNAFVMLEEWRDEAAIQFHNHTPHFKEFGAISKDFLQEPPNVVRYEVKL